MIYSRQLTNRARSMISHSKKHSFRNIVFGTFAAAFGVQSKENLEKDCRHGSIYVYIAAGIIFTALFVIAMIVVVKLVLANSGLQGL